MNGLIKLARTTDKRLRGLRRGLPRRILINARRPMNYCIVAPIHRAMRDDPRIRFYFTASEDPSRATEIYDATEGDCKIISPQRAAIMKFDGYLVADLLWLPMARKTPRIFMFHGVAGKYKDVYDSPTRSMRDWDRIFFVNSRRLRNHVESNAIDRDSDAAKLIGMPKVDCLVDGSLKRRDVLTGLGLDPAKPSVLYAPTWSANSSLNVMGEQIIRNLGDAGYTVIVKLHDGSLMNGAFFSGGVDWLGRIGPLVKNLKGHLATGSDACPYMMGADVLVTDHSSVGFEYLLLDRPVVRIHLPELIAKTNVGPEYVRMLSDVAVTVGNASQVVSAVERSLSDPSRMSDARRRAAADLFFRPGSATGRAVAEIYSILDLQPSPAGETRWRSGKAQPPCNRN